jgi:hypothetical protein
MFSLISAKVCCETFGMAISFSLFSCLEKKQEGGNQ